MVFLLENVSYESKNKLRESGRKKQLAVVELLITDWME
jgi:hypothetical protein